MAAGDWTPSRLGQALASGDVRALYLKVFGGEVLTMFNKANVMMDKHTVRTISSGKTAQFPVTGTLVAGYHTAGAQILGDTLKHNEKTISIDNLLTAAFSVDNLDAAMNHYETRSEYANQAGLALSNFADQKLLTLSILAARASANISGVTAAGTVVTYANCATVADDLLSAITDGAKALDLNNVPKGDRYCILAPAQWYLLVKDGQVFHRDYGNNNGSQQNPTVAEWAGVQIQMSNQLPQSQGSSGTVTSDTTNELNTYGGAFNNVISPLFHRSALGTVKLLDLAIESEYSVSRQATLVVAKYAVGHGILRPEAAVEIRTAASS